MDGIFGGVYPIVKAIISDTVPPKDRGIQMTNVGVVHVFAGLIGPGLGGILSLIYIIGPQYPVATASFGAAALCYISIIITLLFVQESWSKEKREIVDANIDKKSFKLRKNSDCSFLLTQYTFHTIAFIMYTTTLTIFIGLFLGLDIIGISLLLTISGISRVIVRFTVFKPTLNTLGEKRTTELGLIIVFVSFFLLGFVVDIISFIILMVAISYGISCSRGLLISKITQTVPPNDMGKINGYITTLDSIAQIIGPIIGTLIFTIYEPYWWGMLMGFFSVIAFLMVFKKVTFYSERQNIQEKNISP